MNGTKLLKEEFLKLKKEVDPRIQGLYIKNKNYLQHYLYFACYPLFSYVEAVIILCENNKSYVAKSLLRSLIELHINVVYYQVAESDYRLALSVKGDIDEKVKGIREIRELIRKYPNLKSSDPKKLFSNEWLQHAEQHADTQRESVMTGNNLQQNNKELGLKDKAIKCDQAALKDIEGGHFERMYHLIYRQLSLATHLNIGGIQLFVNQKEDKEYSFNEDGDGYFLIQEAVGICVALTKDLYENGVLDGDITDTVGSIEKLLKKIDHAETSKT